MTFERPGNLCIVTAVDTEFKIVAGLLSSKHTQSLAGHTDMIVCRGLARNFPVSVLKTEIGAPGFADKFSNFLSTQDFDAVIVAGFAGALSPDLKTGDPLIYTRCFNARGANNKEKPSARDDFASIHCNSDLSKFIIDSLRNSGSKPREISGVAVERIITLSSEKLSLGAIYDAGAVDMESFDILSACSRSGIPAAVLRIVSDEALCDLPDLNRAVARDGRMHPGLMALAMLSAPVRSFRFVLGIRAAISSLRHNLGIILNA